MTAANLDEEFGTVLSTAELLAAPTGVSQGLT
jgi:hypothetical protein